MIWKIIFACFLDSDINANMYTYKYRIQICIDIYKYMDIFVPVHKCVYVSIYIGFCSGVRQYLSMIPQTMCVHKVHIYLCAIYTYVSRLVNICVIQYLCWPAGPRQNWPDNSYIWIEVYILVSHVSLLNESWHIFEWFMA